MKAGVTLSPCLPTHCFARKVYVFPLQTVLKSQSTNYILLFHGTQRQAMACVVGPVVSIDQYTRY